MTVGASGLQEEEGVDGYRNCLLLPDSEGLEVEDKVGHLDVRIRSQSRLHSVVAEQEEREAEKGY